MKVDETLPLIYRKAVEEGALVITGGGVPKMPEALAKGAWVESTIWVGLPDAAATVTEVIFGPCAHIAPFDTEDEVIKRANALDYGLAASIWTTNLARAHRVADRIEAGIVWVNSRFLRDMRTPFGGMKQPGVGCEGATHSLHDLAEFLVLEVVHLHAPRIAFPAIVGATVLVIADQLFPFGVDRDDGLPRGLCGDRLGVDVLELRIAVGMPRALIGLAVRPPTVAERR